MGIVQFQGYIAACPGVALEEGGSGFVIRDMPLLWYLSLQVMDKQPRKSLELLMLVGCLDKLTQGAARSGCCTNR